jgi:hypothetical protein
MTDVRFVFIRETTAEYEMLRTEKRGRFSYAVHFQIDVDGQWRLDSF